MNPLAIAGGVLLGQYLVESAGGWPALVGKLGIAANAAAQGQALPNFNDPGNQAAVSYLVGLGSVAGIAVPAVDPQAPDMTSLWSGMRANVADSTDGVALATAFLAAYDAACAASPTTYAKYTSGGSFGFGFVASAVPCADASSFGLTPSDVGQAACQLATDRDAYGSGNAWLNAFGLNSGQADNTQILDDIANLCATMDSVGYTADTSSYTSVTASIATAWNAVPTTLATWSGEAVGKVGGAVAAELIGSNLFWAGALALIAWKVLT